MEQFQLFINMALIASQASFEEQGFRQKDVRFHMELFSNWVETTFEGPAIVIHNNQIKRHLETLAADGLLKMRGGKRAPVYQLSNAGLLQVLSELMNWKFSGRPEHFLLLYHLFETYRPKILSLLEKKSVPEGLIIDFHHLLDPAKLLSKQKDWLGREIKKLKIRIRESVETSKMAKDLFAKGTSIQEAVSKIEKVYPYELNNQKPLSELYREVPIDLRRFELEEASLARAQRLWTPLLEFYESYLKILQGMEKR